MKMLENYLLNINSRIQERFKNFKLVLTCLWLMLFKFVLEIVKLYSYLFVFLCFFYGVLKIHVIFSYILILLILGGIDYDERIKGGRYFVFVFIVLIHVIILKEGGYETEILIIQDIFGYSLLMLGSFIGHVLILNGLYLLCEKIGGDYGCYVVSRGSLLTSLTGFLGLILWLEKVGFDFFCYRFPEEFLPYNIYNKIDIFYYFIKVVFILFKTIIEYFCMTFQNYTKILLGMSVNMNLLKLPINFYVYFVLTLIISVIIMKPRIYIIGGYFVIRHIIYISKSIGRDKFILYKYNITKYNIIIYGLLDSIGIELTDLRMKRRFKASFIIVDNECLDLGIQDGLLIYNKNLVKEFIRYTKLPTGNHMDNRVQSLVYMSNIYDVGKIFEYSSDRYKKLLIRLFENYGMYVGDFKGQFLCHLEGGFKECHLLESDELSINDILKDYKIDGEIVLPNSVKLGENSKILEVSYSEFKEGRISYLTLLKEKNKVIKGV